MGAYRVYPVAAAAAVIVNCGTVWTRANSVAPAAHAAFSIVADFFSVMMKEPPSSAALSADAFGVGGSATLAGRFNSDPTPVRPTAARCSSAARLYRVLLEVVTYGGGLLREYEVYAL